MKNTRISPSRVSGLFCYLVITALYPVIYILVPVGGLVSTGLVVHKLRARFHLGTARAMSSSEK